MPSWGKILNAIDMKQNLNAKTVDYLKQLNAYTGRNVLVYYSAWQQGNQANANWSIDDYDRNGFMNALNGLDKTKGLDLILHTPGGDLAATKSIVEYLLAFFGTNIRVIVPHTAMSAGTMIACASKEIILGLHSTLGPIDPQIHGIPANEFLKLFNEAKLAVSKNQDILYWREVLAKYPPTFFGQCQNAINLSEEYVSTWLRNNMLKTENNECIKKTTKYLADYDYHLSHNKRLHIEELKKNTALKITRLEADAKLQDLVLSIFHCFSILTSLDDVSIAKIIENHNGVKFVV